MRKDKGITLIALVITIIVIFILAGITIHEGSKIIQESELQTIKTEMLLIKGKAETLKDKKMFNAETILIGSQIDTGDLSGWYEWGGEQFNEVGLSGIRNNSIYYINYNIKNNDDNGKIESTGDIEVKYKKGNNYYELSEIDTMND